MIQHRHSVHLQEVDAGWQLQGRWSGTAIPANIFLPTITAAFYNHNGSRNAEASVDH